jgi:hypothetical protein
MGESGRAQRLRRPPVHKGEAGSQALGESSTEVEMNASRRVFLMAAAAGGAALATGTRAQPRLDEKHPQAAAPGCVLGASHA